MGTGKARRVRVGIKNLSGQTIDGVSCKMNGIEPQVHGECFPLPLMHMHFSSGPLAPGDIRWIDVAMNVEDQDISLTHTVQYLNVSFPRDAYRIILFAYGDNCSRERSFTLRLDDHGLVFLSDASVVGH
jgi:hypothetical protein